MAIPDEPFAWAFRLTGESGLGTPDGSTSVRAPEPNTRAASPGPRLGDLSYGHRKARPDAPQANPPDGLRRRGADGDSPDYGRRLAAEAGRSGRRARHGLG